MSRIALLFQASCLVILLSGFTLQNEQLLSTSLRVTVLNELGNIVPGATVTVYANEEDYRNSTNPVQPAQETNAKGRVSFKKLDPTVYFLDVQMGDLNNIGLAVQTDTLKPNLINKVNIIIE
ncbi:MAG: carboxypeptidase-like regulatory domain-containing protein [Bacteroidota bacterium]